MKMSKDLKDFLCFLLSRELHAEWIQANDEYNPLEVDYVAYLVKASKEFAKVFGFPYDKMLDEEIKRLLGE
jgi:hypothetical protein